MATTSFGHWLLVNAAAVYPTLPHRAARRSSSASAGWASKMASWLALALAPVESASWLTGMRDNAIDLLVPVLSIVLVRVRALVLLCFGEDKCGLKWLKTSFMKHACHASDASSMCCGVSVHFYFYLRYPNRQSLPLNRQRVLAKEMHKHFLMETFVLSDVTNVLSTKIKKQHFVKAS